MIYILSIYWMLTPCAWYVPEVKEFSVLISSICIYDRIFVGQVFIFPLYIYEYKGDRRHERWRITLLPLLITYTYISFWYIIVMLGFHNPYSTSSHYKIIISIYIWMFRVSKQWSYLEDIHNETKLPYLQYIILIMK